MAKKTKAASAMAPPASPPADDGTWGPDVNGVLCLKVLCHFAGAKTAPGWPKFYGAHLGVKRALREAIEPRTGRAVADLGGKADTKEAVWDRFLAAAGHYGIRNKLNWLCADDVHDDRLTRDAAFYAATCANLKPGMKVGRALTAFLTDAYKDRSIDGLGPLLALEPWCKLVRRLRQRRAEKGLAFRRLTNTEVIAGLVTDLSDRYKSPVGGTLVLSANPLDLLLLSESACFTSCQSLKEGTARRAGPLQYLCDGHTAVAYYYREERPFGPAGVKLPHKLWRQLVHMDLKHGKACLMRQYPNPGARPAGMTEALDALVARALARGDGGAPWWARDASQKDGQPVTYPVAAKVDPEDGQDEDGEVDLEEGAAPAAALAYVDSFVNHKGRLIFLGQPKDKAKPPSFVLAKKTLCPFCGGGAVEFGNALGCARCSGRVCVFCDGAVAGAGCSCPDGARACLACWRKRYVDCQQCGSTIPLADGVAADCNSEVLHYCRACAGKYTAKCTGCDALVARGYRAACRACFEKSSYCCHECGRDGPKADAFTLPNGRVACPACRTRVCADCSGCGKTFFCWQLAPKRNGLKKRYCGDCRVRPSPKKKAAAPAPEVLPVPAEVPAESPPARPTVIRWIVGGFSFVTDDGDWVT